MTSDTTSEVRPLLVVLGVLCMLFGMVSIASIGLPILALGVVLLVAGITGVHRRNPGTFWPAAGAAGALVVGYVLTVPFTCLSTSMSSVGGSGGGSGAASSSTVCRSIIGIRWSGDGAYNPPLWPALVIGLVCAVLAGAGVRRRLTRWRHAPRTL